MAQPLLRQLNKLHIRSDVDNLTQVLSPIVSRYSNQALTSAGLVINAASAVYAKSGASAAYFLVNGRHVTLAAGTSMGATSLNGLNIGAGKFNVAVHYIDSAGAITTRFGTEGASAQAVIFPETPVDKAIVGYLMITYASPFVGGTTALDVATTVYVSPTGAYDFTATI